MFNIAMEDAMPSKRAQIPIFMLLVVAIVLSVAALFVFTVSSGNFTQNSASNSEMVSRIAFGENYVVASAKLISEKTIASKAQDLKGKFMEIAQERDLQISEAGNFFAKIRTGDFSFENKNGQYMLNMTNLFVQSDKGDMGNMKREFDLCMMFDANGKFVKNC
jgi:hypothetical protein